MKRKTTKETLPSRGSYIPPGHRAHGTQFIRVLEDWHGISIMDPFDTNGVTIQRIVGPDKKVYRYAHGWEQPDLVIDANILPPEHHIRLVRERSKQLRIMTKRQLRLQLARKRK